MGLPINIKNQPDFGTYEGIEYKDYWTGVGKLKLDQLEQYLVRNLLPTSGLRLIDLGCGFGRLTDCYKNRFKMTVFFDGSLSLLYQAREKMRGAGVYIAGDINCSPFKKCTFDAALMVRVFHHIPDSQACLSEINRILGSRGVFVFNYSNKGNLSRLAKWIFNRENPNPLTLDSKMDNPWFYQHHPAYIHRLLKAMGFTAMKYRGSGVVDKIAERMGPLSRYLPDGRRIAWIFGIIKVAPWIFCKAQSTNSEAINASDNLDDLLQCPICSGELTGERNAYNCKNCARKFPIMDEIIDFRIR